MQATEEIGWVAVTLLAIAAIVVNTPLGPTNFGIILLIILTAICGVLAMRYEGRDGPS